MAEKYNLTPVELELMNIIWKINQGTVREVMAHLPKNRELAYTSVSTMLRILQQKKILTVKKIGRGHIYLPILTKKTFADHCLKKMVNQIFSGNALELVSYLMNKHRLSTDDIEAIQDLLDAKKKGLA